MGSPIESMIDKACGFDRGAFERSQKEELDKEAALLLAVADAAVAWLYRTPNNEDELSVKLADAARTWESIGG